MDPPRQHVDVQLSERSYAIEIGSGNLGDLGRLVQEWCQPSRAPSKAFVVTDSNVKTLFASRAAKSLAAVGIASHSLVVPAGEKSKSVQSADRLWQEVLAAGADRKSIVIALGGGVVGDLAGFVAATFARGIPLVQVPTTLLAQVDSSVGGKVGINLPTAKNMVGAFWQPLGVLIDTELLATLPEREYRAGLAEVVKYGVILDADFFAYLEANIEAINRRDNDVLRQVVARCCRLKADVVEADERELTGRRAVLNYGHTFCHAIEAATSYGEFLHGEAVAIGMLCASRLAQRLGRVDEAFTKRQAELLTALGLPTDMPNLSHDELLRLMHHDKKTEHGRLRFVLPKKMGEVELVEGVEVDDVRAAMEGE